jgi:hypothetical protein
MRRRLAVAVSCLSVGVAAGAADLVRVNGCRNAKALPGAPASSTAAASRSNSH